MIISNISSGATFIVCTNALISIYSDQIICVKSQMANRL